MKGKLHLCHLLVKGENSEAKLNLNSVEIEKSLFSFMKPSSSQ